VYLIVNKPYGSYPHYSNSGFMMGYLIYGFQWGTPENAASIMGVNMAIVPVLICITLRVIN